MWQSADTQFARAGFIPYFRIPRLRKTRAAATTANQITAGVIVCAQALVVPSAAAPKSATSGTQKRASRPEDEQHRICCQRQAKNNFENACAVCEGSTSVTSLPARQSTSRHRYRVNNRHIQHCRSISERRSYTLFRMVPEGGLEPPRRFRSCGF